MSWGMFAAGSPGKGLTCSVCHFPRGSDPAVADPKLPRDTEHHWLSLYTSALNFSLQTFIVTVGRKTALYRKNACTVISDTHLLGPPGTAFQNQPLPPSTARAVGESLPDAQEENPGSKCFRWHSRQVPAVPTAGRHALQPQLALNHFPLAHPTLVLTHGTLERQRRVRLGPFPPQEGSCDLCLAL